MGASLQGCRGSPPPARSPTEEDDGRVLRRWGWFAALAPLGAASHAVHRRRARIHRRRRRSRPGVAAARRPAPVRVRHVAAHGLDGAVALFIAWAATAMAVGAAFETFLQMNPDVIREPWYPLVNLGRADGRDGRLGRVHEHVRDLPDGIPERRWQRISVGFFWVPVVVAPLSLLVVPHVLMPEVHAEAVKASPTRSPCPPSPGRSRWWSGSSTRGRRSSSRWRC